MGKFEVRSIGLASWLALLFGFGVAPAFAEEDRSASVPAGLSAQAHGTHTIVHFDPGASSPVPGSSIAAYAAAVRDDLDEAYGRLVTGAGGSPNAGLTPPVPDDDGKVDVYLAAPNNRPGFTGGTVYGDQTKTSSYIFLTPNLTPGDIRFRAGHELMHVIQGAYLDGVEGLFEGFANWAAGFALPDTLPLDNSFNWPWLPLDCSFASWKGVSCGPGYGQWLLIQHLTETFGPGFVHGYYERMRTTGTFDVAATLNNEILTRSGNTESLRTRFAAYAHDVWDPDRWATGALRRLRDKLGRQPAAERQDRSIPDSGPGVISVDHLAARYLRVQNDGGYLPSGPDDRLRIELTRPGGQVARVFPLIRRTATTSWVEGPGTAGTVANLDLPFDPANTAEVVLPLINDQLSLDDQSFDYRVRVIRGAATPPANDERSGATRVSLGQVTLGDNLYAGGRGAEEAPSPGCDQASFLDATRGTWFRFRTGRAGTFNFEASTSDFPAVIALYEQKTGAFGGCSGRGALTTDSSKDETFDIFVGRQAGHLVDGHQVRLLVTGPAVRAVAPETRIRSVRIRSRQVTVRFSGKGQGPLRFQCRVDRKKFRPCRSPLRLRRLAPGRHQVAVRALDRAGQADRSPAKRKFRIKRTGR